MITKLHVDPPVSGVIGYRCTACALMQCSWTV